MYRIGDRCPTCEERMIDVGQLQPTQGERERAGMENWLPGRTHVIVCPNGHEHEPHPSVVERER